MIGSFFDTFTGAVFIFSFARFLNICKPRVGRPTSIEILWKWASKLTGLAGAGECRPTGSIQSEIFLQMKFIIFQGCPIKQVVFLPGQLTPYNQLLIQPLLLVPEYCFAENVEARFLKF